MNKDYILNLKDDKQSSNVLHSFDVRDYVFQYLNMIPDSLCDAVIKDIPDLAWIKHTYSDDDGNQTESEHELDTSYFIEDSTSHNKLSNIVDFTIQKLLEEKILENLLLTITRFSMPRFNKYTTNTKMFRHIDHIKTLFADSNGTHGIPALTVLGALNDETEYKGGEFILFGNIPIKMVKGSILIFPSIFLYPHEVNMITSGVRYTFVSWAW